MSIFKPDVVNMHLLHIMTSWLIVVLCPIHILSFIMSIQKCSQLKLLRRHNCEVPRRQAFCEK